MAIVLDELRALHADWQQRPEHAHALLPAPSLVTTMIQGGEWWVTFPASCRATLDITYLVAQADPDGFGTRVEDEVAAAVAGACAADEWLAANPPRIEWSVDLPPMETDPGEEVVRCLARAVAATGRPHELGALDSWYDASSFTRIAGIPAVGFGPYGGRRGERPIDEHVPVVDLVATVETLALAAVDFCGVAG